MLSFFFFFFFFVVFLLFFIFYSANSQCECTSKHYNVCSFIGHKPQKIKQKKNETDVYDLPPRTWKPMQLRLLNLVTQPYTTCKNVFRVWRRRLLFHDTHRETNMDIRWSHTVLCDLFLFII